MEGATAVGKHLFLRFDAGLVHVHLGLFGRFRPRAQPAPEPRPSVRMRLRTADWVWDLTGPIRCEVLDGDQHEALLARLGADPLAETADPVAAWAKVKRSRRAVGAVLLDQSVLAGLGNVYRAELLFLLGVHPLTPVEALGKRRFLALWKLAQKLLSRGVEQRRIVTREGVGARAPKREALYVYGRRRCAKCNGEVVRVRVGSRPAHVCERCQPPYAASPLSAADEDRLPDHAGRLSSRPTPGGKQTPAVISVQELSRGKHGARKRVRPG